MTAQTLEPIPNRPYSSGVLLAGLVAVGVAVVMALYAMGGTTQPEMTVEQAGVAGSVYSGNVLVLGAVGVAVFAIAMIGLVPTAGEPLVTPTTWGLVALGATGAQTIAALGAIIGLTEGMGLERKPVVYGILGGVFVLLTAEAILAVLLLAARDRKRKATGGADSASVNTTAPRHTTAGRTA